MPVNLSQAAMIPRLNAYLRWNNYPLQLNEGGVCNGLASVHAKYRLQGKEAEFFKLIEVINSANQETYKQYDPQTVNQFVLDILLSYKPFNNDLTQHNSMEELSIDQKSLKSSFNFSIATTEKNWCEIIKQINIRENEVVKVASTNHAVSLSKENGQYKIYDPNYRDGHKTFATEEEVINELRTNVFNISGEKDAAFGLRLNVIPHPDNPPRSYPDPKQLYDNFLDPAIYKSSKPQADSEAKEINILLKFAVDYGDEEVLKNFLEKVQDQITEEEKTDALLHAVIVNNSAAVQFLLPKTEDIDNNKLTVALSALNNGRKKIFDETLNNKEIQSQFYKGYLDKDTVKTTLKLAVQGGNADLIKTVLDKTRDQYENSWKESNKTDRNVAADVFIAHLCANELENAVKSGKISSVRLLMERTNQVFQHKDIFTPEQTRKWDAQKLDLLNVAVKKNQPNIVSYLLKEISPESLKNFSMSLDEVEDANVSILKSLKEHGVNFSFEAQGIIAEKEHRPIGIILSIGIALSVFTDFLKLCKSAFSKEDKTVSNDNNPFSEQYEKIENENNPVVETLNLDDFLNGENFHFDLNEENDLEDENSLEDAIEEKETPNNDNEVPLEKARAIIANGKDLMRSLRAETSKTLESEVEENFTKSPKVGN